MPMKVLDMFCGMSAFRTAAEQIGGFSFVGYCDNDPTAVAAYRTLYKTEGEYFCNDARAVNTDEIPDFDLLVGGFPYRNCYVQTFVVHPSEELLSICKALRLDNYIAIGNQINKYVLMRSKELFGKYKILCRAGILNIIPANADEEEINKYVSYLKNHEIR